MLPYRDSRLVHFILLAFFVAVVAYAFFEGRALLRGPTINVSPRVMEVSDSFVIVSGTAERITQLSLNGAPIAITEDGAFEEGYVLTPGYNLLILDARDKYGKTAQRSIEIFYKEPTSPPPRGVADEL